MAKYKITMKAVVPRFLGLFSHSMTRVAVYEANSAAEATEKAEAYLKNELDSEGLDPEIDNFTVSITDVEKL